MEDVFKKCHALYSNIEDNKHHVSDDGQEDKSEKYNKIIDNAIDIIDQDGNIISENTIEDYEIEDIILKYLNELDITDLKVIDYKDILAKLNNIADVEIFMIVNSPSITFELESIDEFVKYIKAEGISKIFVSSIYTCEEYHCSVAYNKKIAEHGYNIDYIKSIVDDFIVNNGIQMNKIIISTINGVGISYNTNVSFIQKVNSILSTCAQMLYAQDEAKKRERYINAIKELPRLLEYISNDNEYRLCTNATKRKNYKVKAKFLQLPEFSNIREMLEHKPVINTEEYYKVRDFYIQYDSLFT